ncbi:MAG TPA: hypothetical protein VFV00_01585 [Acidimicrobiales bacterium]|nr:hypothetical protein [Acidimicrobiales bacterium]
MRPVSDRTASAPNSSSSIGTLSGHRSGVEFPDSTGLDVYIRWHHQAQRGGFHVVYAPGKLVQRVLEFARLDELLAIER